MQHSADMRMGQAVDAVATNCLHSYQFESGLKPGFFIPLITMASASSVFMVSV